MKFTVMKPFTQPLPYLCQSLLEAALYQRNILYVKYERIVKSVVGIILQKVIEITFFFLFKVLES